ncbi:hypothetical protein Athai_21340 [Actinocatenispora thailandica]|uniref:Methylamine utilisation protein MauE domain-containing protein n=1 Tax=Actinocatenispora thailandica TaxID=227318 RepID=A0A7R7DN51_9ACTN|nr:MauE/DoxX family redox-associated membrane protein [Actinocatenispora thailandica]BCJ34631.1 hypothetical protein Athai_21340 [Actinocatenispora thailandica]
MGYVEFGLRVFLAGVFAVAAGGKRGTAGRQEFVAATGRLLPSRFAGTARPVATVVRWLEWAIVLLLVVGGAGAVAGFALVLLSSIGFGLAIVAALRRGEAAPCRCFGASSAPLSRVHVARNVLLALAALAGAWLAPGGVAAIPVAPGLGVAGVLVALVAGAVAAALMVRLDEVVDLFGAASTPGAPPR